MRPGLYLLYFLTTQSSQMEQLEGMQMQLPLPPPQLQLLLPSMKHCCSE